jgi:hypothetical protein
VLCLLAACADRQATQPPPIGIDTITIPTITPLPPTLLPPTGIPTLLPCDPFNSDFCVADGHFILQRPILPPGNASVDPTYRYASTSNGTRDPHHGVEFANPNGTPVHAAAEGTVVFAGADTEAIYSPWRNFYGNLVVVEHAGDVYTLYAHLSRIDVQAGQRVLAGDRLGEVGRTGGAIGSHLHFEVRQGNASDYYATQNPELWLAPHHDASGRPLGTLVLSILTADHVLVRRAEFTVQQYPEKGGAPGASYYGSTYSPDLMTGEENALLGELPAGHYRIAVDINGQILERWVEVEWGRLTQVVLIVE